MSPLFLRNGKLLVKNNALAGNQQCCCGCCCVNGENDPTKTTAQSCTDAGGIWFEAPCNKVTCNGCQCLFPLEHFRIKFDVSANLTFIPGGININEQGIILDPDNANGLYVWQGVKAGNTVLTLLFGCDVPDNVMNNNFGITAAPQNGVYWSTITLYYPGDGGPGSAQFIRPLNVPDEFGIHNLEPFPLMDGDWVCKPTNAGGNFNSQYNMALGTFEWFVTIEEP